MTHLLLWLVFWQSHNMRNSQTQGFTLLELLVAMSIFAFMSVMAFVGLNNALTSNEVITEKEQRLASLQRAVMFIEKDFRQIVLRPRTSGYQQKEQAFAYGLDSSGFLEFTRAGNQNATGLARSNLQRVRYDYEDKNLIRNSWSIVDHLEAEPLKTTLLEEIDSIEIRLLDQNNEWKKNWSNTEFLPKAIEITIEHAYWGKIKRLISL